MSQEIYGRYVIILIKVLTKLALLKFEYYRHQHPTRPSATQKSYKIFSCYFFSLCHSIYL